jgi:hypothetical protein
MTVAGDSSAAWFPEPSRTDNTYANRGEPTTDWLRRSTVPRARGARRFLNENHSKIPSDHQHILYCALHERWGSAYFELIVARTLQVLGAEIEIEPGGKEDIRIDFVAHFPESTVSVEAVAPKFNADTVETAKRRASLLDMIEALVPPGWRIIVEELPDLGPSDSKRSFRRAVERLLDTVAPEVGSKPKTLIAEVPGGEVRLRLLPQRDPQAPGSRAVVAEPALTAFDNSEQRIRRAIKQKRRQGRNVNYPAILAVHATGISSEFYDFNRALFGRDVGFFDPYARRITKTEFQADGVFSRGSGDPTWAAVLAFVNVNFPGGPDPVLYLHPRYRGTLPEALTSIERRSFDPEAESVNVEPSQNPGFLKQLGFVSE